MNTSATAHGHRAGGRPHAGSGLFNVFFWLRLHTGAAATAANKLSAARLPKTQLQVEVGAPVATCARHGNGSGHRCGGGAGAGAAAGGGAGAGAGGT